MNSNKISWILTELWSEKFEWFDPSPIEPFNPARWTRALVALLLERGEVYLLERRDLHAPRVRLAQRLLRQPDPAAEGERRPRTQINNNEEY